MTATISGKHHNLSGTAMGVTVSKYGTDGLRLYSRGIWGVRRWISRSKALLS
jgi:hypothetical protein